MASYGFEVYGDDGRLWLSDSDLTARIIGTYDISPGDNKRWISISGITKDNACVITVPGYYDSGLAYDPEYIGLNNGGIRVTGSPGKSPLPISVKAKALVFRYR